MAKLLENTYRHVNIALVNEMAIFCHELGIDLWDSIRCAATKPFGFQAFYPGPGVGGHCIPIDPNYLSYKVRAELKHPFRFVELAQEINSRMPGYVVDRAAELLNTDAKPLNGAKVLLLGVTYKKDIADQRESPARPIARKLLQRGAVLSYHDPYVDSWQVDGKDIRRAQAPTEQADLTILLQAHTELRPGRHRGERPPAVRHPWQDFRRLGLPAVGIPGAPRGGVKVHVVVCTVVHHPADARDLLPRDPGPARRRPRRHVHRSAWGDCHPRGDDPSSAHPTAETPSTVARPGMKTKVKVKVKVTRNGCGVPSASSPFPARPAGAGWARCAPRGRRWPAQVAGADLLLVHDPELLLVLPPKGKRPPTVWDVHEDTAAALTTKAWLPEWLRPVAAGGVTRAEHLAERNLHLILAEHGYNDRFAGEHPVVPNTTYVPEAAAPPSGPRRVVYVGWLSPDRGSAEMMELGRLLKPHGIAVELIGPADAAARAHIEAGGDAVHWHGFVPNAEALRLVEGCPGGPVPAAGRGELPPLDADQGRRVHGPGRPGR